MKIRRFLGARKCSPRLIARPFTSFKAQLVSDVVSGRLLQSAAPHDSFIIVIARVFSAPSKCSNRLSALVIFQI
jgi:hypothetical protein